MVAKIKKISKVHRIKLKLHKRLTMKGLYYRQLINNIYRKKDDKNKIENNADIKRAKEERNIFDRYC